VGAGEHGTPLPLVVEAKLRSGDRPMQGERLEIAYDPADLAAGIVVLVSETEYSDRLREYVRRAIRHGSRPPARLSRLPRPGACHAVPTLRRQGRPRSC